MRTIVKKTVLTDLISETFLAEINVSFTVSADNVNLKQNANIIFIAQYAGGIMIKYTKHLNKY